MSTILADYLFTHTFEDNVNLVKFIIALEVMIPQVIDRSRGLYQLIGVL